MQNTKDNSLVSLIKEYFLKEKFVIRTFFKPDENFLFHYVYGVMANKMSAYHAFAHLNNDGLSSPFIPNDIGQITQLKNENYVPIQMSVPPPPPVTFIQGNPLIADRIA